jgi:hypothetical protein
VGDGDGVGLGVGEGLVVGIGVGNGVAVAEPEQARMVEATNSMVTPRLALARGMADPFP